MTTAVTPAAGTLGEYEAVIERGLGTFLEVGAALLAIRDGRLYRATHTTFGDYCRERWHFSRSRAYQLMAAADLSTTVDIANERQARALLAGPAVDPPGAGEAAIPIAIYPGTAYVPDMTPAEYRGLVESIRSLGLLNPLVVWRGQLIDGRQRLRACRALGVMPTVREYTGDDPDGYIFAANINRQHLTEDQRAMLAVRLMQWHAEPERGPDEVAADVPRYSRMCDAIQDAAAHQFDPLPEVAVQDPLALTGAEMDALMPYRARMRTAIADCEAHLDADIDALVAADPARAVHVLAAISQNTEPERTCVAMRVRAERHVGELLTEITEPSPSPET